MRLTGSQGPQGPVVRARRSRRAIAAALGVIAAIGGSVAAAPAQAKGLPLGVHATNELTAEEVQRMGQGDVGILRVLFRWEAIEPNAPVLGTSTYDWDGGPNSVNYDNLMRAAGREKIDVLPILVGTPDWARDDEAVDATTGFEAWPVTNQTGAESVRLFMSAVADRYGRDGAFWDENPNVRYEPIKDYQIWNEPNRPLFAPAGKTGPRSYWRFLKESARDIRTVDPKANIVFAGMPPRIPTGRPLTKWLRQFYELKHAKQAFDTMALHPYASSVEGVKFLIDELRGVMRRAGDKNRELWISEFGWASDGDSKFFSKNPKKQRELLVDGVKMMRNNRDKFGLGAAIWFSWRDRPDPTPFNDTDGDPWQIHTGLFKREGGQKPVWEAFTGFTGGSPGQGPLEGEIGIPLSAPRLPIVSDVLSPNVGP